MPFKRRNKILNKALINSSPIGEVRCGNSSFLMCKFAPNPCHECIPCLGGGVECAWRKASGGGYIELVGTTICHSEPFLLDFQAGSVIPSLNIYPCEESREFRMQQTQILSGSFEQSSQDDRKSVTQRSETTKSLWSKHNELVSLLTRHSELFLLDFQVCSVILSLNIYPSEESRQISLDCFVELSSSRNDRKNFPFSSFNFPFFITTQRGGALC